MPCSSCGEPLEAGEGRCAACGAIPAESATKPRKPLRPIRNLASETTTLLGVSCAALAAVAAYCGNAIATLNALIASPEMSEYDAVAFTAVRVLAVLAVWAALSVPTVLVFLVWLFRARANAEAMAQVTHRYPKPWLIFAWLVPIVNLIAPKHILDDIFRASHPAHPGDVSSLKVVRHPRSGYLWWSALLSVLLAGGMVSAARQWDLYGDQVGASPFLASMDKLRGFTLVVLLACVMLITAGIALAVLVHQVTRLQEQYRSTVLGRNGEAASDPLAYIDPPTIPEFPVPQAARASERRTPHT